MPAVRLAIIILAASFGGLLPAASRAARPWKPDIHVPPTERLGRRISAPDAATMKRFAASLEQGRLMLSHGKYEKARAALAKAVGLYPAHFGARLDLARVLLTLGYLKWDYELVTKAQENIAHAIKLAPDNEQARLLATMIRTLMQRMRPDK